MERRKMVRLILIMMMKWQRQRNDRMKKNAVERRRRMRQYFNRRKQMLRLFTTIICVLHSLGHLSERTVWCKSRPEEFWHSAQDWDNSEWKENFRMTKSTFQFVCQQLSPFISKQATKFRKPIPVEKRVAIAIWRLATNSDFRTIGHLFGVGKSTAVIICHEICKVFTSHLLNKFVFMPANPQSMGLVIQNFSEISNFPQVAGAVDGCHIPIVAPCENHCDYFNRKGFYSVLLQGLVDSNYCFTDIYIGWPGRVHDARVFQNSPIFELGQNNRLFPSLPPVLINNTTIPILILGDPAYPLLPWVMKPYPDTGRLTAVQKTFNFKLSSARMVVENAFGRLKGRWRCLLKRLDTKTQDVPAVITTCCILHNICEMLGDTYDGKDLPSSLSFESLPALNEHIAVELGNAEQIRNSIAHSFS